MLFSSESLFGASLALLDWFRKVRQRERNRQRLAAQCFLGTAQPKIAKGHEAQILAFCKDWHVKLECGAGGGNRTHGLGIMRPSLCH